MNDESSFSTLMAGLRAGDGDAAAVIFHRYSRRLIALASRQFDLWVETKADPEDVVQSVFKSFFSRFEQGRFVLDDWDKLWSLLTLVTLRKCGERLAYLRAGRRDAARELRPRDGAGSWGSWEAIDREPTPLEAAMLADLVRALQQGLDPAARAVAELSLQGFTAEEVAARLGRSERTVWRVREKLRNRLGELLAGQGAAP